jgi:ketosteroid isomerase-like protein
MSNAVPTTVRRGILRVMAPPGTIDVIRDLYAAMNRGDVEAAGELVAPDAELFTLIGRLEGRPHVGPEGLAEYYESMRLPWESMEWDLLETIEVDDERVLCVLNIRGRGRDGVAAEQRAATVATVRDDRVVHAVSYLDKEEALDALRES